MATRARDGTITCYSARAKLAKQKKKDASTIAHEADDRAGRVTTKRKTDWDAPDDLADRVC